MAVKRINESIGPHVLVPTIPVYCALLRLGLPFDQPNKSLYERSHAQATEWLSEIYAESQVDSELSFQHTPYMQPIHEACIGKSVLVYRTNFKV